MQACTPRCLYFILRACCSVALARTLSLGLAISDDRAKESVLAMKARKPANNLPLQLTSFIGREREVAETKRLLSTTRLVTLTGPGGAGKTRLALQVAADLLPAFPDGAWLAELAALSDSMLVPRAVAAVFDLRESRSVPLMTSLIRFLKKKNLLLVLDNCEHLIAACAQLVDTLLRASPGLSVVATSREPLVVPGEAILQIPNLTLPDPRRLPPLESLAQFESVRLFVERASAARPDFHLIEENASAIASICHRLDGLPLGIELAASRVRTLSIQEIAARLDDRFRLLTSGSRTAPSRQQTLQASIAWSFELLTATERALLRRLSVFTGGWTLEAAQALGENDRAHTPVQSSEVLDLLARLVDKSMIIAEERNGGTRFRMLETIREFARAELLRSGEDKSAQSSHLEWFVRFAERAEIGLQGKEAKSWIDQIATEHENMRAAWTYASEHDLQAAAALASGLLMYWVASGSLTEGRAWVSQLLERTEPSNPTATRARALNAAGHIAWAQSDLSSARSMYAESLRIARHLEDEPLIARALLGLGMTDAFHGDPQRAADGRPMIEQALAMFEKQRDEWHCAFALNIIGVCEYSLGRLESAQSNFNASLRRYAKLGNRYNRTSPLLNSAELARTRGDYQQAAKLLTEIVGIRRELSPRSFMLGMSLHNLGCVLLRQGDLPRAKAHLESALGLLYDQGNYDAVLNCLRGLAGILTAMGKPRQAAQLYGSVDTLTSEMDLAIHLDLTDRQDYEYSLARLRDQLNEQALSEAWQECSSMTLEQAIQFALRETASVASSAMLFPRVERGDSLRSPELRILALGPVQVLRGSHVLSSSDWKYAKSRELLLYLLCYTPRTREQIGLALWPDASPPQLRSNVKVTLYYLRKALGRQDWILFHDDQYSFNYSLDYWFDVQAFESSAAQAQRLAAQDPGNAARHLETAAALYRGDFLTGWTEGEWYLERQAELQREYAEVLLLLGQVRFGQAQYAEAVASFRKAITVDSFLEIAHRELMRAMARQGERGQALRHYHGLKRLLQNELGAPPAAETEALYEQLRLGEEI